VCGLEVGEEEEKLVAGVGGVASLGAR